MKRNLKSAFIVLAGASLFAACSNVKRPHVYGPDEVSEKVREGPPPNISQPPPPPHTAYPPPGDVPSHPKDFSTDQQIDQGKQQMEDDREDAGAIKQRIQSTPQPTPLPPPAPAQ